MLSSQNLFLQILTYYRTKILLLLSSQNFITNFDSLSNKKENIKKKHNKYKRIKVKMIKLKEKKRKENQNLV